MLIGIVHTPISNIGSLKNILSKIDCETLLIKSPEETDKVDALIIPGVGSFPVGKQYLDNNGISEKIISFAHVTKKPVLGICLGMHLLMKVSFEHKKTFGLNLFEGSVEKIKPEQSEQSIHMGWNSVHYNENCLLFKDIPQDSDFYFVHSYQVLTETKYVKATTAYAGGINSVIEKNNIFGVQFHPEKSQKYGIRLLKNFVNIAYA